MAEVNCFLLFFLRLYDLETSASTPLEGKVTIWQARTKSWVEDSLRKLNNAVLYVS